VRDAICCAHMCFNSERLCDSACFASALCNVWLYILDRKIELRAPSLQNISFRLVQRLSTAFWILSLTCFAGTVYCCQSVPWKLFSLSLSLSLSFRSYSLGIAHALSASLSHCSPVYGSVFPLVSFAPTFVEEKYNYSAEAAARIASIVGFISMFLSPVFGCALSTSVLCLFLCVSTCT
jgi:hypothetical protein